MDNIKVCYKTLVAKTNDFWAKISGYRSSWINL
jgi:hypothetical protein